MEREQYRPVVLVVAYNRINSLQRLFSSLLNSKCPENTRLIISIDNDEYAGNEHIFDFSEQFRWPFGEKEIIFQDTKMGLKDHIISCGKYSEQFGSVILLEDDLYVSPYFYQFAEQALNFYSDDDSIAGISLFNYPRIEKLDNPEPFIPLKGPSDVYFIQHPSSWGQAWTKKQWQGFNNWYQRYPSLNDIRGLPPSIFQWGDTSWKKYFLGYMIEHNKYFVYPFESLTTNFDDKGTNRSKETKEYQAPLKINDKPLSLLEIGKSFNVYDAFFEILPEKLNAFDKELANYDYEVDLYGTKPLHISEKSYFLTKRKCNNPIKSYARSLKPHEMNVIQGIGGEDIFLCHKNDILATSKSDKQTEFLSDFRYFYRELLTRHELNHIIMFKARRVIKKVLDVFR